MATSLFSKHWYRIQALKPKLRGNTISHRHYYRGATWYIISGKSHKAHLRLNAASFFVYQQMDGERTVAKIWEDCMAVLNDDAPSQDDLLKLLTELFEAGFVDVQQDSDIDQLFDTHRRNQTAETRARYFNPLFLRFAVYDPDRVAGRILPAFRWMFTPGFGFVWALLIVIASIATWFSWDKVAVALSGDLTAPDNLIIIWFVFPVMKLLHELAHALAVKRWGGEVHEFGIALLVLLPVPYIDASASTGFGSKHRRMAVAAAGIVVESSLACLGLTTWLLVEPGLISDVAFNVFLTGSVSCLLFNGNPLLKFDSYYVLADWIEIPNLAARSNQYLLYLTQKYLLGLSLNSPVTAEGERGWFICYGVTALVYRLSLTVGICLYVASEFFFLGILLAIWAIGMQICLPIGKAIVFLVTNTQLRERPVQTFLATTATTLASVGLLFFVPFNSVTHVRGVVWPIDEAMIRTATDCFIEDIYQPNGVDVQVGEEIVRCANDLLEAEVLDLRAEATAARAILYADRDRVERSIKQSELQTTQVLLEKAEEKYSRTLITSAVSGALYLPNSENMTGRYFRKGEVIGYILNDQNISVRTMLNQERVALLDQHVEKIELRLTRSPELIVTTDIERRVPAATQHLVSPALSRDGGGDLFTTQNQQGMLQLQEAAFDVELKLPQELRDSRVGDAVEIRFDHGNKSFAGLIYREIQLLLLRRFNV